MAWRQPGKLRPPPTRRPHRPRPRPWLLASPPPIAEVAGAVERADDHTTPPYRSRREPGCRQGPQPLHRHGLDPPRALATADKLECHRLVVGRRRWPARRVAEATCSWTGSRSSRPLCHGGGDRGRGRAGGSGASREAGPRAPTGPTADLPSRCAWPAARTSAITRTDLRDLTRGCPSNPSMWRVPGGCRLGCAVRRLVLGPARGWGREAGSVGPVLVRRAGWLAGGWCGRAGWWGR
jgi:hypothetical protein